MGGHSVGRVEGLRSAAIYRGDKMIDDKDLAEDEREQKMLAIMKESYIKGSSDHYEAMLGKVRK